MNKREAISTIQTMIDNNRKSAEENPQNDTRQRAQIDAFQMAIMIIEAIRDIEESLE